MATVSYPPFYPQQIFDADGKPVAGGRILSFYAGTDVPLAMFAPDGVSLGSSVSIASDGTAVFCLKVGVAYKLVCVDSNGATVWVRDRVKVSAGDGGGMVNPMDAKNQMIVGGVDGDPMAIAPTGRNQVVTFDGDDVVFSAPKVPAAPGDTRYKDSVHEAIDPVAPLKKGVRFASGGRAWMMLEIEPSDTEGDILKTLKNADNELFVGWGAGGGGGGMTNPMTGFGQMIFGGPGGAPTVLSSALAAGKYLKSINVGPGRYQPVWEDLPSTCQENFSLLNVTNFYDAGQQTNKLFCSKVVANETATRSKLAFFHKSGDVGKVILGVYDNAGNLLAQTAPFSPDSSTFEQMCWNDTLASFTLTAGEEYWFAAYFTPDNWSCTVNALGLEKSSAFDVNLVGSRSVGVLTELPATLGTLSYETLAWYMSAM